MGIKVAVAGTRTLPAASVSQRTAEFEALFQEHYDRIYAVLFRLTGNRAEAEDLTLETFWRWWERPPKRNDNVAGWLYRVAIRLGYNALRSAHRRSYYETTAGMASLASQAPPDPAGEVERNETRAQVRAALQQMRPREAQILILRYSGLSYQEIAAALGVAPSSVGALLARAETTFAQYYRRYT